MIDVFRPPWPAGHGLRALTTTRHGGVSQGPYAAFNLGDHVGDEASAVAENRRRLLRAAGCHSIQWLRQVHGSRCVRASVATLDTVPDADAAWTDTPGLGLAVLTADCVPIVLGAPAAAVIGVAHAGWRGLVGGVVEALVDALPVASTELIAWLGPAIGPADYQVDAPLLDAVAALPDGEGLVRRVAAADAEPGRWRLDLFELAAALLERSGVTRVDTARISTFADPRCFSHRRAAGGDGRTGRLATLAWLPDPARASRRDESSTEPSAMR